MAFCSWVLMKGDSMRFLYKESHDIFHGMPYLAKDTSVLFRKNIYDPNPDFSVLLSGNWRFSLDVLHETGRCTRFTGFLDELGFQPFQYKCPQIKLGALYFDNIEQMEPGSGTHYLNFKNACFFDTKSEVLCFGTPSFETAIEFATNTIAVIKDEQLMCIYLKVPQIMKYLKIIDRHFASNNDIK